jgi:hypothetical protein
MSTLVTTNKALATAMAEGACKGIVIHHLQGDFGPQLIATRGAITKPFDNVSDLRVWIAEQPKELINAHV